MTRDAERSPRNSDIFGRRHDNVVGCVSTEHVHRLCESYLLTSLAIFFHTLVTFASDGVLTSDSLLYLFMNLTLL